VPYRQTRRFPTRRSGPNRSWAVFANTAPVAVAASTKILLGMFDLSNPNIDETVLRTVGSLEFHTDQTASGESQIGAVGMILVNDLAIAAGAASIPGPITDGSDDGWFFFQPLVARFTPLSSVGVEPNIGHMIDFDSKAKRKIQEGFQIAIMVENASASNAFDIAMVFRTLTQITGT